MILAGGEGKRLRPLTSVRTKPAVPFGGNYRIIDFALSNFVKSGFLKIFVLTQFKSHSLMQHLREGWRIERYRGGLQKCKSPRQWFYVSGTDRRGFDPGHEESAENFSESSENLQQNDF